MSTHLIFSKERKLAAAITFLISVSIVTFIGLYKIPLPPPLHSDVKSNSIIDLAGIFETSLASTDHDEDKSSCISSKLPAGISQSVLKMETEMFTNSFISSFSQSTVLRSNHPAENDAETPGKEPNRTIGKSANNPDLKNETKFIGGNLKNRKLLFIDKIKGTNEEGSVVIKLSVNSKGEVINAEVDPGRTTSSSTSLRSKALESASTAIFETTTSSEQQTGFITFQFEY